MTLGDTASDDDYGDTAYWATDTEDRGEHSQDHNHTSDPEGSWKEALVKLTCVDYCVPKVVRSCSRLADVEYEGFYSPRGHGEERSIFTPTLPIDVVYRIKEMAKSTHSSLRRQGRIL